MKVRPLASSRPGVLPWRRHWVRQGNPQPVDYAGFLVTDAFGLLDSRKATDPLLTLEDLADVPCVIALGEPGLGKSTALEAFVEWLVAHHESDRVLALDLGFVSSREELLDRVFRSPCVTEWRDSGSVMHLVLDSLDESPMPLEPLCATLVDELGRLPLERLRLVLACRTAVLPVGLIGALRTTFTAARERAGWARVSPTEPAPPLDSETTTGADEGGGGDGDAVGTQPVAASEESVRPMPTAARAPADQPAGANAAEQICVVVELAVLSREDVRSAAANALGGPDRADVFLAAVVNHEVGHFAARPITLHALIRRYADDRTLPASQVELFRDLCHHLCDPVGSRVGARRSARGARTSRDERYLVAGRLCAAVLFGNRAGVYRGDGQCPARLVDPAACVGSEWIYGAHVRVTEAVIAEALDTALFTGESDELSLAVHQTFAEFVAADWVAHRRMETAQVLALLQDPTDPERRVVPQLRQVAAWLAALDSDVFAALASREPEIVLWSDVVQVPLERRLDLAAALLDRTDANRLAYPGFGARAAYARLKHHDLPTRLAPVVADRSRPVRTRARALEIASACSVGAMADLAAEVALDESEQLSLRVEAAFLVGRAGGDSQRAALFELVLSRSPADEADELRGAALLACWSLFTPDELFAMLWRPRRPNWSGAYSIALDEIASALEMEGAAEYAIAATRWLALHPVGTALGPLRKLADAAALLALGRLDEPDVFAALLTYVRRRLVRHLRFGDSFERRAETAAREILSNQSPVRRRLTRALLNGEPGWRIPGTGEGRTGPGGALAEPGSGSVAGTAADGDEIDVNANVRHLPYEMPELLPPGDVPWAIGELAALPADDTRRVVWRDCVRFAFLPWEREHLAAALCHRRDPDVAAATAEWIKGHESVQAALDAFSRERDRRKTEQAEREARYESERRAEAERLRAAPFAERLADAVTETPSGALRPKRHKADTSQANSRTAGPTGRPGMWQRVYFELVRDPANARMFSADPRTEALVALGAMGKEVVRAVLDAAVEFLRNEKAEADPFPKDGRLPWRSLQGAAAATLLARFGPARLNDLGRDAWACWLPTLVRYEPLGGSADDGAITAALAAADAVGDVLDGALIDAIDANTRDGRRVSRAALGLAGRPPVASALSTRLANGVYPPESAESLLRTLLRAGGDSQAFARSAAVTLLAGRRPPARSARHAPRARSQPPDGAEQNGPAGARRDLAIAAAAALVAADVDAGWESVGRVFEEDPEFARDALLFGARHDSLLAPGSLDHLSEARIATLFVIAQRTFPPETDPWHVSVYSPGARDHVGRWRDGLLNTLETRATDAAVAALERLAANAPGRDELVQVWLRASAARLRQRWLGTPAKRLMRLAEAADARLVESGEQLLDVLEESLQRLNAELQGEWRSAVGLWDHQRSGRRHSGWLPKDEGHLANEIARHLRRDVGSRGIIVGRELVVQVGVAGGAPGLRTDIDVRARRPGGGGSTGEQIRAIIEVKGSWHPEVRRAMEDQLLNDYLVPHGVRHGLFVVGHYTCAPWTNTREKRRSARLGTRVALTRALLRQAEKLSTPFRAVRAFVLDVTLPAADRSAGEDPLSARRGRRQARKNRRSPNAGHRDSRKVGRGETHLRGTGKRRTGPNRDARR